MEGLHCSVLIDQDRYRSQWRKFYSVPPSSYEGTLSGWLDGVVADYDGFLCAFWDGEEVVNFLLWKGYQAHRISPLSIYSASVSWSWRTGFNEPVHPASAFEARAVSPADLVRDVAGPVGLHFEWVEDGGEIELPAGFANALILNPHIYAIYTSPERFILDLPLIDSD